MCLGWGGDPQQPSSPVPVVCGQPAPTRARRRGQAALVCPHRRQTVSVCPWETAAELWGRRGEMAAELPERPWGDGYRAVGLGCGAKRQSSPSKRCGRRRGGMRRRSQRRGGSRDLLPDPTRPPFPAGRPWLAPLFSAIPVGSCIPAWRPTRAAPASGIACSPSPQTLPAAACGCSPSPPLSGKAALNPAGLAGSCCQHPLAPCPLQPLPGPACTRATPKNFGVLAEHPAGLLEQCGAP